MKLNHQSPGNVENRQITFATILVHYTIQARWNIWGQWGFVPHLLLVDRGVASDGQEGQLPTQFLEIQKYTNYLLF